jgi:hypothetical protein
MQLEVFPAVFSSQHAFDATTLGPPAISGTRCVHPVLFRPVFLLQLW